MNDSPAETGGCPCLAITRVGGTGQSWDGFASVLLPGRICITRLSFCLQLSMEVFCHPLPSHTLTSPLDLTASALQPPSSPAFVGTEWCRVPTWLRPLFGAVTGCFLPTRPFIKGKLSPLFGAIMGVFFLRYHLLRASSGPLACISQSRWVLCYPVSAAYMASCLLVTMAPVQPRGHCAM